MALRGQQQVLHLINKTDTIMVEIVQSTTLKISKHLSLTLKTVCVLIPTTAQRRVELERGHNTYRTARKPDALWNYVKAIKFIRITSIRYTQRVKVP